MPVPYLVGPRLRLRPLERSDLPRYQELSADAEINMLYGGLGLPSSMRALERWYDSGEADITDRRIRLGIEAGGTLIGSVSLFNEENLPSRSGTFGILIGDRAYLGRGYGGEASILFLTYAFGVLSYHKINLDLFEYNTRAFALYQKLGFVVEGRRRENHWARGRFWDDILMGITAKEWWQKHGPPPPLDAERAL